MIASSEERALYDAFAAAWSRFEQADATMRRLMESGQQAAAIAGMSGSDTAKLYDDARAALTRDVALNEDGARRDANASMMMADAAMLAAYIAVALALVAACAAAAFSLMRVSRPIQAMTDAMAVLAGGDAAAEVPYRQRGDEIGAMASAVQVFKDNLIRTRQLEAETAQARLAAEERRKAGMRLMADRFEAAVGGIIGLVSSSATELQASATELSCCAAGTPSRSASRNGTFHCGTRRGRSGFGTAFPSEPTPLAPGRGRAMVKAVLFKTAILDPVRTQEVAVESKEAGDPSS